MLRHLVTLATLAVCLSSTGLIASAQEYPHYAPPPPVVEQQVLARPGYVWIPGHHRWDGHKFWWVYGYWSRPPYYGAEYYPGHWSNHGGGIYVWVNGHWAP